MQQDILPELLNERRELVAESAGANAAQSTVRVDSSRLDRAMNQVGELVLLRNRLSAAVGRLGSGDETLVRLARETDLAVNDLQNTVMSLRMQPCQRMFQGLPAVVRETAHQTGRKVRLALEGHDVELDKAMLEVLSAPLTQLVRNAIEHGIEGPEERTAAGKPTQGTIRVAAVHLGDKVQIQVSDDGRGMDPQRIRQSALERHLIRDADAARMSERELLNLVLLPGFRSGDPAGPADDDAGLDQVHSVLQSLRGRVDIENRPQRGTRWSLELPLSLAVLPVLYFRLRREIYAVPVSLVDNLMEIEPERVHNLPGASVFKVDEERTVPYVDLGRHLHGIPLRPERDPCEGILTEQGLLVVSEAMAIEDSVVKPLDVSQQNSWYQGATISGGGEVVLILDVDALMRAIRAAAA